MVVPLQRLIAAWWLTRVSFSITKLISMPSLMGTPPIIDGSVASAPQPEVGGTLPNRKSQAAAENKQNRKQNRQSGSRSHHGGLMVVRLGQW